MPKGTDGRLRPTLVSLFTGAGGLDIGLELSGFRTVAAVDADSDCVATLRLNQERALSGCAATRLLTNAKILQGNVENFALKDLRPDGARSDWSPDLVAGGPPCQPFSSAGRMLSLNDPRGRLFEHFVRLAKGLKPRVILFENVRSLVTALGPHGRPGEALTLVRKAFESIRYDVLTAKCCGSWSGTAPCSPFHDRHAEHGAAAFSYRDARGARPGHVVRPARTMGHARRASDRAPVGGRG